jgi:tRNA uridine 5-carbamoylmethylation protein Kti12
MNTITAENIMSHILQKKRELEELEKLNDQMMNEAVSRAASGGRNRAHKKFKDKLTRNSVGSSPSVESPEK